jgi:hypothetical protein
VKKLSLFSILVTLLILSACQQATTPVVQYVANPIFNLPSGSFTNPIEVTITTATPGASIYYTTGNVPASLNATLYTGPLELSGPTTLRAIAAKDGMVVSGETECWYAYIPEGSANLISNGDFSAGKNLWILWLNGGAAATYAFTNGELSVALSTLGSSSGHIAVYLQQRFLVEQGQTYRFSFDAWADSARIIGTGIREDNRDLNADGSNFTNYSWREWNLTPTPTTYSLTFTMANPTDDRTRFVFNFGQALPSVHIDNVVLERILPEPVTIEDVPDPVLRSLFEEATGKPFDTITTFDLLALREIHGQGRGIADLTGIELCKGLLWLDIGDNTELTDISPITALQSLTQLFLVGNPIEDYSPIGSIPTLKKLLFSPADTSSLAWMTKTNLPKLKGLQLHSHHGLDYSEELIEILEDFSWSSLSIAFPMDDSQFAELFTRVLEPSASTLQYFNLWANPSQLTNDSIDNLSTLTNLLSIGIWSTQIVSLDFLTDLTNLKYLDLRGNIILTDLAPIKTLHESGGLQPDEEDPEIKVILTNLGMDLTADSSNRLIIDYLLDNDIIVEWEEGNIVEDL